MSKTFCEQLANWRYEIGHSPASAESAFRMRVVDALHTIVDPLDTCVNPPPKEAALIELLKQNIRRNLQT